MVQVQDDGKPSVCRYWLMVGTQKKGKEANEIDIVAISVDGKTALIAEVKRQQRNFNHKTFMEKVEKVKTSILPKYYIDTLLLTLEDM